MFTSVHAHGEVASVAVPALPSREDRVLDDHWRGVIAMLDVAFQPIVNIAHLPAGRSPHSVDEVSQLIAELKKDAKKSPEKVALGTLTGKAG